MYDIMVDIVVSFIKCLPFLIGIRILFDLMRMFLFRD